MSAGQGGHVRLEIDGHLAWVTLSHPGRLNAITVGMWASCARCSTSWRPTMRCAA